MNKKSFFLSSLFLTDAYKLSHHQQYPEGTTLVYSNFTPRSNKYATVHAKLLGGVVVFGVQLAIKKIVDHFNENFFLIEERKEIPDTVWGKMELQKLKSSVMTPIKEEIDTFFNTSYDMTHFEKLWDLGYLPLEIRSLDEGTICPIRVPMLTIHNTKEEFYWLPNYLETILSQFLWKPVTSATIALTYRNILEKWAHKTNPEGKEGVLFQGHDFSMRGLDDINATIASGLGHLTSFLGTDSLPTLQAVRYYYGAKGFIAGSVPATEHSVMCAGSKEDEIGTFKRLLKIYPNGFLSVVSDTWNLWHVVGPNGILHQLKKEILARDGKLVIRPDSGDPVDIICGKKDNIIRFDDENGDWESFSHYVYESYADGINGDLVELENEIYEVGHFDDYVMTYGWENGLAEIVNNIPHLISSRLLKKVSAPPININEKKGVVELLWDEFGGTINEQGYKVLDSHIGAIYGDSITTERAEEICGRLEAKGFASTNVVFGIGSYTYQYNTRDTFGFALKATYVERWVKITTEDGIELDGIQGFEIYKDPITDDGLKKSAKGLLKVVKDNNTYKLIDQVSWEDVNSDDNELKVVFLDGHLVAEVTFEEIRERIKLLVNHNDNV